MEPYDAIVLAGGEARRLGGVDKPSVVVGGRPLIERVADAVADARRLIVVGPGRSELPRALYVREDPPGRGPVPALEAGLEQVIAEQVVLLAADLPFVRGEHVAELRGAIRPGGGAVVLDDTGSEQWLISAWHTDGLRAALRAYTGTSLHGLLGSLDVAFVHPRRRAGAPPPWHDCDISADIVAAREWTR